MKSSCLWKSLLCLPVLTFSLSALADIAPVDSRPVGRSFSLAGLERYPDQVFIACQTTPSRSKPMAAYRLRSGEAAALVGYKFDRIHVFSAPAADWKALHEVHGVAEGWTEDAPDRMSDAEWEGIRESGETVGWQVGRGPVLHRVEGEVEAAPFYVPKASVLAGEARVYHPTGASGAALILESLTERFTDGTPDKRTLYPSALRANVRRAAGDVGALRLSRVGRSVLWTPERSGMVTLAFHDAEGRTLGSARRVATAGETLSLPIPGSKAGSLVLTARWHGGN